MSTEQRKTIQINPDFLKFPMKGNKTRKARENKPPKPIKIRDNKPKESDKTIKRRALNLIRRMQEDKYRRLTNGQDVESTRVEMVDPRKTYADEFKSDFDDSLAFLQKLTDQTQQKISANHSGTLKQYPVEPKSTIFNNSVLNQVLSENVSLEEPDVFRQAADAVLTTAIPRLVLPPQPGYGCLKRGKLPTYRTFTHKTQGGGAENLSVSSVPSVAASGGERLGMNGTPLEPNGSHSSSGGSDKTMPKLSPEQQRAELKQFLNKKTEEKKRVEQIKRQRNIINPRKHQRRKTTRTFRVGKSKFYPRVGVLIPNKTIRTQVLATKQKIRETPTEEMRKHLIKKGLIRVGSSCPNDVLRQMYESSMMMCGELQNHNPDNLLFNYLNNAL